MTRRVSPGRAARIGLASLSALTLVIGADRTAHTSPGGLHEPVLPGVRPPVPARRGPDPLRQRPDALLPGGAPRRLRDPGGRLRPAALRRRRRRHRRHHRRAQGVPGVLRLPVGHAGTDGNGNTTFSGDSVGVAPRLQQMFKGIGTNNELWSGVMTQYCEGVSSGATRLPGQRRARRLPHRRRPGRRLGGHRRRLAVLGHRAPARRRGGRRRLALRQHHRGANRNAQYVIVSPHGTTPDGFNTPAAASAPGTTGTVTPP